MKCIIENERISFVSINNETKLWLRNSNTFITMDYFYACDLGNDVRFVFYIDQELPSQIKKKSIFKKQDILKPFQTAIDYPNFELHKPELIKLNLEPDQQKENYTDVIGVTLGSLALLYSAYNQIKQKKKQLEESKCCSESKINYEKLNTKIENLISQSESNKKALYTEIYENYKELKELKEDSTEIKQVVSKLIDRS